MQTCASFHNPPNLVLSVYLQTPPRPYGVDSCARHMWRLDVAWEVATTNGVWSSTNWKADSVLKLVRSPAPLDSLSTYPWAKSWTLSWPWCIHPSTASSNSWVMILWKVWDKWEMEKFCLPVCVGFTATMESGWTVCVVHHFHSNYKNSNILVTKAIIRRFLPTSWVIQGFS